MALELDDRVTCRACGTTVWEADCIDGLCGTPHWTGSKWVQGCAIQYYAWAKANAQQVLQPDGSLLNNGDVEATLDAWLEAGAPDLTAEPKPPMPELERLRYVRRAFEPARGTVPDHE